ncbi:hypothetical protein BC826DRAFT_1034339 [Russula brevipes]|nr:hypothetical protein BC826DRAFT_1034339 [Russula brevipes]
MTVHAAHDQVSLVPAPTITPEFRCKTCKAPLLDATFKNCDRCRRIRTESYNRWKKSDLRKAAAAAAVATPGSSRPPEASSSSAPAPAPNPNPPPMNSVVQTANIAPNPAASQAHDPQWRHYNPHPHPNPTGSSSHTGDRPQTASAPVLPRVMDVQEYQWASELVDELAALPPRSTFMGKFSIVYDPAVDNAKRAFMFADQLRARALFISKSSESTSRSMDRGNAFVLLISCACQTACRGQIIISADDDKSHPYGIPGQRIGVTVLHSSS